MTTAPPRIAIIAALPRELSALVKGWQRRQIAQNVYVWSSGSTVAACAGMGAERSTLACDAAIQTGGITDLISAGFAGACAEQLRVGQIVRASLVVDAKTGERFEAGDVGGSVIATSAVIAGVREKRRLRETYGAAVVDMESATVARMALAHGLKFRAIKVVSDEIGLEMADLSRFTTVDGQFREAAFALHGAVRPWMWPRMIALGRRGLVAACALRDALAAEID